MTDPAGIDLSLLADLVAARAAGWRAVGAVWAWNQRPTSASEATVLSIETSTVLVELTVWRKGEASLIVAGVQAGIVMIDEHYEVTGGVGLLGILDDVDAALEGRA